MADLPDEIEPEDIEELHAQAQSLLRAQAYLDGTGHDAAAARDLIAQQLDLIRQLADTLRILALAVRRQPELAGRIADRLQELADATAPKPPDEDE